MWKNKLKAIWNILRSDIYCVCTLRNPKHESDYMQAGWFHYQMPQEADPYFLTLVEEKLHCYAMRCYDDYKHSKRKEND